MSFYTNVKVVGNDVFLRGVNDEGDRFNKKVKYSPTIFLPSKEKSKHKTLGGQYVKSFKPGSLRETRDFISDYKDVSNYKIYGNDNFAYTFIGDNYPDEIEYDITKIVVANIDIEVASDQGFPHPEAAGSPVISIAVKFNEDFYVFGFDEPEGCVIEETLAKKSIKYVSCEDEKDLLIRFVDCWSQHAPDVVTGWNVSGFDIPYLYNRLERLFDQKVARSMELLFLIIQNYTRSLPIPIEKVIGQIIFLMWSQANASYPIQSLVVCIHYISATITSLLNIM